MRMHVKQRDDDQQDTCHILPLSSQQQNTSVSDVVHLLLSLAHFSDAKWQSSLAHLQRVQSVDFYPFSCYLKGSYAAWCFLTVFYYCISAFYSSVL